MSQPFNIPPPPISHKKRAQGFNRANFAKALALVAPGLGQLVLGRFLKGIFFIAITALLLVVCIWPIVLLIIEFVHALHRGIAQDDQYWQYIGVSLVGIVLLTLVYCWSLWDATREVSDTSQMATTDLQQESPQQATGNQISS